MDAKFNMCEQNVVYADLRLTSNGNANHVNNHCTARNGPEITRLHSKRKACEYAVLRFDKTPSPPSYCWRKEKAILKVALSGFSLVSLFRLQPAFGQDIDDLLYADMYDDVKSGKIADPRLKPPLPPKGASAAKPPKLPPKIKAKKGA